MRFHMHASGVSGTAEVSGEDASSRAALCCRRAASRRRRQLLGLGFRGFAPAAHEPERIASRDRSSPGRSDPSAGDSSTTSVEDSPPPRSLAAAAASAMNGLAVTTPRTNRDTRRITEAGVDRSRATSSSSGPDAVCPLGSSELAVSRAFFIGG